MTGATTGTPAAAGCGLYRVAGVRALEALAFRSLASAEVMERAGRAAADWVESHAGTRRRVLILAGPGNNGGDGVVAARHLHQRGFEVTVLARPSDPKRATGDAGQAWARLPDSVRRAEGTERLAPEIVVDALFGIGLSRPLGSPFADWIRWSNAQPPSVLRLAIDVPSGLDADRGACIDAGNTGAGHDAATFVADATITFIADKPGLHTGDGPDHCGEVRLEALGLDQSGWPAPDGMLLAPPAFSSALGALRRRLNSHKGSFGALALIGGYAGTVGALLLAARAGQRLGAGRVYVGFVPEPPLACDPVAPELMLRTADAALAMAPDTIAIGPGLGQAEAGRAALRATLATDCRLVLDADALNLLAGDAELRNTLAARPAHAVLTPHPLEAARLLGCSAREVQVDRVDAACRLAHATRALVALKGQGTVVAAPDGGWWINPTGGPALASGGTGDVLTGMIGALLAQGVPATQACLAAVWTHGRAADQWVERVGGSVGLAASELIDPARALINTLIARTE